MRRKGIWMSVLAMAMFAGSASAITADGDYTDWFSVNPAAGLDLYDWNDGLVTINNLNYRTQVDPDNDMTGGQDYDIEQIFYYFEDADVNDPSSGGTLHIGLVTGFDGTGEAPPTPDIFAGDMFIDVGLSGDYVLAVAVGDEPASAGRRGTVWVNNGWTTTLPTVFPAVAPYRVDETQPGAGVVGLATVGWGAMGTIPGRRNFLEISLAIDGTLEDGITGQSGGVGLHWTMGCGNDVIDVIDDTPFVPVPEPATMMLLGMGVLGIALRSRKPSC